MSCDNEYCNELVQLHCSPSSQVIGSDVIQYTPVHTILAVLSIASGPVCMVLSFPTDRGVRSCVPGGGTPTILWGVIPALPFVPPGGRQCSICLQKDNLP